MTFTFCHGKIHPFLIGKPGDLTCCHGKSPFLIGKPSISMGHGYHGKLLVITRGSLDIALVMGWCSLTVSIGYGWYTGDI